MRQMFFIALMILGMTGSLQSQELTVATVTRPPFSMPDGAVETGFSLALWDIVAKDLGQSYNIPRVEQFGEMLGLVRTGKVDAAVANISITADREAEMDFSQPIFESGLQVMVPSDGSTGVSLISIFLSRSLLTMLTVSIALLFGAGMLMWRLEKKSQPYFNRPAREAVFPAFWCALNLVVNGGFEERQPTTTAGRVFGVF